MFSVGSAINSQVCHGGTLLPLQIDNHIASSLLTIVTFEAITVISFLIHQSAVRVAKYSSPQAHIPRWATFWITQTPLIFLVVCLHP